MNNTSIKAMFPDWESVEPAEWSHNGRLFQYGKNEKEFIEVGLYREPMDGGEYAGTYTLQVFDGDSVIACHTVE